MHEHLGLGGVCRMRVGIFDLQHVKVIWGHSVRKKVHNSKRSHRIAKQKSGVYVACVLVFLNLIMARSFGVIRCTFSKKWECNSKLAHRIYSQTYENLGLGGVCSIYVQCTFPKSGP